MIKLRGARPCGNPEIARTIVAAGIRTNVHDSAWGRPCCMIQAPAPASRPGPTGAWRFPCWRRRRVIAPDMVGFGFTERPAGAQYTWTTGSGRPLGARCPGHRTG